MDTSGRGYWDGIAAEYQRETHITCSDFHFGPLLPGDRELGMVPPLAPGSRCLELGCGAGQNSIYLARLGATCVAADLSGEQLQAGRQLAERHGVSLSFIQMDLDTPALKCAPVFDFVHSVYALPFLRDPAACVTRMAAWLRPGGCLLLSTAHPLASGEWVDLEGEDGVFLTDYFAPPPDCRSETEAWSTCRAVPLSTVFAWIAGAGLQVDRLLEPRALPVRELSSAEINRRIPYWSTAWLDAAEELDRIPFVAIFRATKPI